MARIGSMLGHIIAELRRRQVFRVLGIYAIIAWVILQVAADTFEPLNIPAWIHTALIVALIIGFPIALVLAWVFDITPEGLVRTEPLENSARLNEFGDAVAERPRLWIDMFIIVVLLGLVIFLLLRPGEEAPGARAPSIAVLPFVDMSEHRDNKYFSDGLTEALIASLAQVQGLQVASGTSSFAFKHQRPDIRDIGARLGVETVLEGSVRKASDNRLKITAQLIDVKTNFHLWSETYDGHLEDIFMVQEDIARSIARALHLQLVPGAVEALEQQMTADAEAYELYLRARGYLRGTRSRENLEHAIGEFKQALRRDPRFALAEAGLCTAYVVHYEQSRDQEMMAHAQDACLAARNRDDSLAEVHGALGILYFHTGRLEFAFESLNEALRLDPDHAEARRWLGRAHARNGDAGQAEKHLKKAVELDPYYWAAYASLGNFLLRQGREEEAEAVFRQATELDPPNASAFGNLGAYYLLMNRIEDADEAFRRSLEIEPTDSTLFNAGNISYYLERYADAREMYRQALARSPNRHEYHGGLADSCRQLADAECAATHYRMAISLVEEKLRVNPTDPGALAALSLYLCHSGEREEAGHALEQALALAGDSSSVLRAGALIAAYNDEIDVALDYLERLAGMGYPLHLLAVEPDLDGLHGHPRFQAMLPGD